MAPPEHEHDPLDTRERYSLVSSSVKNWNWRSIVIEVVFGHVCAAIGVATAYADEAFWLAYWFGGMIGAWLVHNILLAIQLFQLHKQRHEHVKKLYGINLAAVILIDLVSLISFVYLKTTQDVYPNSQHAWIWAMAGLQLFPFIACLESTWRYRRYMLFVTTHQHLDDISLNSVPSRRTSRRDSSARPSTANRASTSHSYSQTHADSTATDSETNHPRRSSSSHSHLGGGPPSRSTTFSRPTSAANVGHSGGPSGVDWRPINFSLGHGKRGGERREEISAEESSDEEAPALPRRSSRRSMKHRG